MGYQLPVRQPPGLTLASIVAVEGLVASLEGRIPVKADPWLSQRTETFQPDHRVSTRLETRLTSTREHIRLAGP